jgi:ABC-2 type transport system permease protein
VSFINALKAEFAKLLSTRLWWVLMIILVVYVTSMAAMLAAIFGGLPELAEAGGMPPLPPEVVSPLVYSTASSIGYVFPILLGALATTAEFRHQTLTPTFLVTPRRSTVLVAKLIALSVFGALYGVASLIGSVGAGAGILAAFGVETGLDSSDMWAMFGRIVLSMVLWAAVGVALGVLVRSQVAAIVILLAFTQFVEPILRLGASAFEWTAHIGKFLPGAASDALVGASVYSMMGTSMGSDVAPVALEWWQGGLVLLALAVAFSIAGHIVTWRKDVT